MATDVSRAPWTHQQIQNIRSYQRCPLVHELTCGECGATLDVTRFWLECPNRTAKDCRYRQTWVPALCAERDWDEYTRRMREAYPMFQVDDEGG